MIRKSVHTIDFVLSQAIEPKGIKKNKENRRDMDGDVLYMDSHRYWTFKQKGVKCSCGAEGKFFAKEKHENDKSYHFNLYAIVDGKEVLMTKDHIVPKSKGGADHIDNYQTMCEPCNKSKGNEIKEVN